MLGFPCLQGKYCAFMKWVVIEFRHRGPSVAFPCQKRRKRLYYVLIALYFCLFVCFETPCLLAGLATAWNELQSNLRCFTVISRLCCRSGDCCTDSEWGRGDCKGVGGECVCGWVAGWVWVPPFVACTSLPRHRERERAEAAVT